MPIVWLCCCIPRLFVTGLPFLNCVAAKTELRLSILKSYILVVSPYVTGPKRVVVYFYLPNDARHVINGANKQSWVHLRRKCVMAAVRRLSLKHDGDMCTGFLLSVITSKHQRGPGLLSQSPAAPRPILPARSSCNNPLQ